MVSVLNCATSFARMVLLTMNKKSRGSDSDKKDKFETIAKEIGCDQSGDALDGAIDGLDLKIKPEKDQQKTGEEE